jgi:hypothetical protein
VALRCGVPRRMVYRALHEKAGGAEGNPSDESE